MVRKKIEHDECDRNQAFPSSAEGVDTAFGFDDFLRHAGGVCLDLVIFRSLIKAPREGINTLLNEPKECVVLLIILSAAGPFN